MNISFIPRVIGLLSGKAPSLHSSAEKTVSDSVPLKTLCKNLSLSIPHSLTYPSSQVFVNGGLRDRQWVVFEARIRKCSCSFHPPLDRRPRLLDPPLLCESFPAFVLTDLVVIRLSEFIVFYWNLVEYDDLKCVLNDCRS